MNQHGSSKKEPKIKRQESIYKLFVSSTQLPARKRQKCSDCGSVVETGENPNKHVSKCNKCVHKTSSSFSLMNPTKISGSRKKSLDVFVQYSTKMTQSCTECHEVFTNKCDLQKHMVTHGKCDISKKNAKVKKKVSCSECNQLFCRKIDLQSHRKMVHSKKKHVCPVCKRTFDTEKRLKMHSQFHNVGGEFKCHYCDKQFNKGWKMKIHLVNHTGRAPYICQRCGEDFLYPGKIANHMKQVHDLWHSCKDCGIAFKCWIDFHRHACKVYCCRDCTMCYETYDELAAHAASHSSCDVSVSVPDTPINIEVNKSNSVETIQVESSCNREIVEYKEEKDQGDAKDCNIICESTCFTLPEPTSAEKSVIVKSYLDHPYSQEKKVVKRFLNYSGQREQLDIFMGNVTSCFENEDIVEIVGEVDTKQSLKTVFREGRNSLYETLLDREKERDHCKTFFRDITIENIISSSKVPFSVSSCNSVIEQNFKVPDACVSSSRKCEDLLPKSLQMRQEKLSRSIKKKLKFCVDSEGKSSQRSPSSFESWLTGDTPHDFVFGYGTNRRERGITCSDTLGESHCQYLNKMFLKKEKSDMSFEDLCLF